MSNDINNLSTYMSSASPELIASFEAFYTILEQFNGTLNLVSKGSMPKAGLKHFTDCFLALEIIKKNLKRDQTLFDFGAGNGFPGIIAGLMFPNLKIVMVERDQRKAEFLKVASNKLNLKNMEVYDDSVSSLKPGICHQVISRAMAAIPKILLESRNCMASNGEIFLMKGDYWSTEFGAIPAQLFEFWDVDLMAEYELPEDEGSRYIVKCKRV